jgi:hypothetical protein
MSEITRIGVNTSKAVSTYLQAVPLQCKVTGLLRSGGRGLDLFGGRSGGACQLASNRGGDHRRPSRFRMSDTRA